MVGERTAANTTGLHKRGKALQTPQRVRTHGDASFHLHQQKGSRRRRTVKQSWCAWLVKLRTRRTASQQQAERRRRATAFTEDMELKILCLVDNSATSAYAFDWLMAHFLLVNSACRHSKNHV